MPAPRGKKRKSEQQSTASNNDHLNALQPAAQIVPSAQYVATKTEDDFTESPSKRRKVNITVEQKQGLINNLQIELADRARKLRSQYNAQIRNLRARIEIRVNRIPPALRKVKMGDLLAKRAAENNTQKTAPPPSTSVFKPPPVPQKDYPIAPRPPLQDTRPTSSNTSMAPPPRVRRSDIITGGDKENEIAQVDSPKRNQRPATANGRPTTANGRPTNLPSQILSPASSNSRMIRPSERMSPTRSFIARPVSPVKPSVISNLVEKARSTTQAASSRKTTTMSSVSTTSSSTAPLSKTTRTRKTATATTAAAASRAGATSRSTRRISAISESSDGSTGTVVRKRTTTAAKPDPPAPAAKRTVMGTIRKGVAGAATKKAAATKAAPAGTTGTGRVLRKRNP